MYLSSRAFAVHIFTASGTALAFLAMIAAVDHAWSLMFLWLGIALLVDGLDGPLARRFAVATVLPRWSGDTLDLVIDFLNGVDTAVVADWFNGASDLIDSITTSDGYALLESQVQALIDALGGLPPQGAGDPSLAAQQDPAAAPVLAAAWQPTTNV